MRELPEPETEPIPLVRPWGFLVPVVWILLGVGLGIVVMSSASNPRERGSAGSKSPNYAKKDLDPDLAMRADERGPGPDPSAMAGIRQGAWAGLAQSSATGEIPANGDPSAPPATPPGTGQTPPILPGSLPGGLIGGTAPLKPIVIEGDRRASGPVAFSEYVSIVPELDVEPTIEQVRRLVRAAGGRVHYQFEREPERPELGTDLIVALPPAAAAPFKDAILKGVAVQEIDRWSGPSSERHFRMERFLRDAEAKLEQRVSALRMKYHDDAPLLVRTNETLERCQNALKAFRSISADQDALRIFVGKSLNEWP